MSQLHFITFVVGAYILTLQTFHLQTLLRLFLFFPPARFNNSQHSKLNRLLLSKGMHQAHISPVMRNKMQKTLRCGKLPKGYNVVSL